MKQNQQYSYIVNQNFVKDNTKIYPIDWRVISDEIMMIVEENTDQQNFKLQIQQIKQSKNRRKIADSVTNMESNLPRIFDQDNAIDKRKHKNGIAKAVFSKNVDRIICLDQQSDEIFMYDSHLNIDFKTRISGKANIDSGHVFDTIILDFDISERDRRVGTVMRDYTICFWDYREMFKFESNINYNLEEIQIKIWFLEHCNHWFTTDKQNNLYAWHLENVIPKPLRKVHNKPISCITEIQNTKTFSQNSNKILNIQILKIHRNYKQITFQSLLQLFSINSLDFHLNIYSIVVNIIFLLLAPILIIQIIYNYNFNCFYLYFFLFIKLLFANMKVNLFTVLYLSEIIYLIH